MKITTLLLINVLLLVAADQVHAYRSRRDDDRLRARIEVLECRHELRVCEPTPEGNQ